VTVPDQGMLLEGRREMVRIRRPLVGSVLATLIVLGTMRTAPAAEAAAAVCRAPLEPWTEINLYFGSNIANGGLVSEQAFRRFLAEVVTPRFPDGLSILDVAGQFRSGTGAIVREPSKLLVILVPDAAAVTKKVDQIIAVYKHNVAFIANLMESGVELVAVDMPRANRLTLHILAVVAWRWTVG
jgi:hypothetical protein